MDIAVYLWMIRDSGFVLIVLKVSPGPIKPIGAQDTIHNI